MNSVKEINEFLDNVDCGEAVYSIDVGYGDLCLNLSDWDCKNKLSKSDDWLIYQVADNIRRCYSASANKMILQNRDNTFRRICDRIVRVVIQVGLETSPAAQPRRTKVYKELMRVSNENEENSAFIDDILPVLNYYYKADKKSEDFKVHTMNTHALLGMLIKKHGNN